MKRRTALKWIVRGIGLSTAAVVGAPAIGTLLTPVLRRDREETWRPVGPLADFPPGQISKAVVGRQAGQAGEQSDRQPPDPRAALGVFVWRRDSDVVVYSRACTDLSCPLTHDRGSEWFFCPCHGGIFNKEGEPVAGPPAYPMYRYRTRIRAGVLEIDLHSVPPMT